METRNQADEVAQILRSGHKLKSMQQSLGFLPTTKQVICRVLNEDNFLKSKAANTVAQELFQLWTWCKVCTNSTSCMAKKAPELVREFSNLDRHPKANRETTFFKKEAGYVSGNWINCLTFFVKIKKNIDVCCLRMCSKDYQRFKMYCCD